MAGVSISRRTGALIAGVVPPTGVPLPQQTVGVGTWLGSPSALADPALRAELLRVARLRRELRAGHLAGAARIALEVNLSSLPDDPEVQRTVAVLRSVGASCDEGSDVAAEAVIQESFALLGTEVPPALLDSMLAPSSRLPPDVVERLCVRSGLSTGAMARLRVLLVRRAAQDFVAAPSSAARIALTRRAEQTQATHLHHLLTDWTRRVVDAAVREDRDTVSKLVDALGPNLPLTDPRNKDLHDGISACFKWDQIEFATQRRLARLAFSAWSTLRDVQEGRGSPELTSFSAQAAAFRQVFEILLSGSVLKRFLASPAGSIRHGLLDAVRGGQASIGIGRWYGLLFSADQRPDALTRAAREWFGGDHGMAALREQHRLRLALGELLQVRLHSLPHDESSARTGAFDVLETVARVGFGAARATALPEPGAGLVGLLCQSAA
jgi:hypothetical protein